MSKFNCKEYAKKFIVENNGDTTWDNIAIRHLVATLDSEIEQSKITLRDQFAMAALTAIIQLENDSIRTDCESAYRYADAMLKAREESK